MNINAIMWGYIMKHGLVALVIIFTVMSINSAVAGGRHGNRYNSHSRGHGNYYNYHRGHGRHSYGPRRYYGSRRAYGYYDSHGDYWAYALGGLVVGGVLGAAVANSYNNQPQYYNYGGPVYVNPNPASNAVHPTYVLQPDGICYVVNAVNNGNLVLSPVSPGNCQ